MYKRIVGWLLALGSVLLYLFGRQQGGTKEQVKQTKDHTAAREKKTEVKHELDAEAVDDLRARARAKWLRKKP